YLPAGNQLIHDPAQASSIHDVDVRLHEHRQALPLPREIRAPAGFRDPAQEEDPSAGILLLDETPCRVHAYVMGYWQLSGFEECVCFADLTGDSDVGFCWVSVPWREEGFEGSEGGSFADFDAAVFADSEESVCF